MFFLSYPYLLMIRTDTCGFLFIYDSHCILSAEKNELRSGRSRQHGGV